MLKKTRIKLKLREVNMLKFGTYLSIATLVILTQGKLLAQDNVSIQRMKRAEIEKEVPEDKSFFIETFYYEDYVYSKGKKTQLGDQTELSAALRYQFSKDTFFRTRFETFPEDNRFNNKTNRFELLANHQYDTVNFQLDLEINTNDKDSDGTTTGGSSVGLDLDSEFSVIQWQLNDYFKLSFYPFNFDGEVGVEFNTWDVTRMYFIDGGQASFIGNDPGTTKVAQKTIPGLELTVGNSEVNFYVGAGAATYLSPTNPNFDIQYNTTAIRWERKENIGYKFGANYLSASTRASFAAVGHTQSDETGSLLERAAAFYILHKSENNVILESEFVTTKAGKNAWRLNRASTWFEQTTFPQYQPIYSDYNGNRQDWLGKNDFAVSMRLGYELNQTWTPYTALRFQGKHFIYSDPESANALRTADESQSHGGLYRFAMGSFLNYGKFVVNPELEYRKANNAVFTNAADAVDLTNATYQGQRLQAKFSNDDVVLKIQLTYSFDGSKPFSP